MLATEARSISNSNYTIKNKKNTDNLLRKLNLGIKDATTKGYHNCTVLVYYAELDCVNRGEIFQYFKLKGFQISSFVEVRR